MQHNSLPQEYNHHVRKKMKKKKKIQSRHLFYTSLPVLPYYPRKKETIRTGGSYSQLLGMKNSNPELRGFLPDPLTGMQGLWKKIPVGSPPPGVSNGLARGEGGGGLKIDQVPTTKKVETWETTAITP